MGAEADPCALAWAAGIFEGEGCFHLANHGRHSYLSVSIQMSDLDVMERFGAILGFSRPVYEVQRRTLRPGRDRKVMYRLASVGQPAVEIAGRLRPWLGERRTARLDEILAQVAANPPRMRATLTAENVMDARMRYAAGGVTYKQLANEYGVGLSTIHAAVNGDNWKHLPHVGTLRPDFVHAG